MTNDAPRSRGFFAPHRQVFGPAVLRRLRASFYELTAGSSQDATSERELRAMARGEGSDTLRLRQRWFDVWRTPSPDLLEMVRPFTWVIFPPQVRHVSSTSHFVPWHQDTAYISLLGPLRHTRIVTCHIPLDDEPARRSTLQFTRAPQSELTHQPRDGFAAGLDIAPEDVVHFELSLGDCLFFGDHAVHRTYTPPGALIDRRSLEFRLIDPEDSIANKDYFDIELGTFRRRDGPMPEKLPL